MIDNDVIEEIHSAAPPPVQNIEKNLVEINTNLFENEKPKRNKLDNIDEKWEYYSKNKNFLLRFGLINIPGKEELIRFEVLNTKIISENYEMFGGFFQRKNLIDDLEIKQKSIEIFTFLYMLFEKNPPEGDINHDTNEFILIITKSDTKKYSFTLKNTICEDDNFFEKNVKKKLEQFDEELEETFLSIEKENDQLNLKNNELVNKLNKIVELNENLKKNNIVISDALKELEKNQEKAFLHLSKLKD